MKSVLFLQIRNLKFQIDIFKTIRFAFGWMLNVWFDSELSEVQFSSTLGSVLARFSVWLGSAYVCLWC